MVLYGTRIEKLVGVRLVEGAGQRERPNVAVQCHGVWGVTRCDGWMLTARMAFDTSAMVIVLARPRNKLEQQERVGNGHIHAPFNLGDTRNSSAMGCA